MDSPADEAVIINGRVYIASQRGERDENEDRHSVVTNFSGTDRSIAPVDLYALYDGHGGDFVSRFLSENIPRVFSDARMTYPPSMKFIKRAYTTMQNELRTRHSNVAEETGATCVCVLRYLNEQMQPHIYVMNTGDSRAIICRGDLAHALTTDHKPGWPSETARITKLGGELEHDGFEHRICGLSVSRAFGDIDAEPFVTCIPDTTKLRLSRNDKFIIVACDGLWDVMSNQDAANFVLSQCYDRATGRRTNKKQNIADMLARHAIRELESTDNVSVIVAFLD